MRVAWVSHQWPSDAPERRGSGLLSGRYAGGAEYLQEQMRTRGDGIEWVPVHSVTGDLSLLDDCDRVVVGSPESLDAERAAIVARFRPLVWCMSIQPRSSETLLDAADIVLWASYQMRGWHAWGPRGDVCQGWFDTTAIPRGTSRRNGRALWSAREHPQKGLGNATAWARGRNITLTVLRDVERQTLLDAMSEHTYFVLLANGYDCAPITIAEARIAGCETITNDYVGRPLGTTPEGVAEWIEQQPERFYKYL